MKKNISFFSLVLCLMLSPFFVFAQWSEPINTPPQDNADAPVNIGTGAQDKQGALTVLGNSTTAKGFMVGSNTLILQAGENLIYGNIDIASVGNLLLLQNENATKLIVTKDGNVGIGTANPMSILNIVGENKDVGHYSYSSVSAGSGADYDFYRARGTETAPQISQSGDKIGSIRFKTYDGANFYIGAKIEAMADNSVGSVPGDVPTKLEFWTMPNVSVAPVGTLTIRMTIRENGNVGIGTTAPAQKLDVSGQIHSSGDVCTDAGGGVCLSTAGGGSSLWTLAAPNIYYNTGNVGIGTAAPNKLLHLKTASGNAELDIQSAASPYWGIYQDDTTDDLRFWNSDNRMTITNEGSVGIGTTAPAQKLDVAGQIHATGDVCTDAGGGVCLSTAGGGSSLWTLAAPNIYYNTGNVGIGTAAPASKLMFGNGESNVDAIRMGSEGRYGMGFNTNAGGYFNIWAHQTAARIGMGFDTGSYGTFSEKLTILSAGNVGIGTTAPGNKLHVAGGNIGIDQPYAFIFANGQTIRDNGGAGLAITSPYAINFNVGSVGSPYFTVMGGNVGIGTTGPTERLDVSGNIKASGSVCGSAGCIGQHVSGGLYGYGKTNSVGSCQDILPPIIGGKPCSCPAGYTLTNIHPDSSGVGEIYTCYKN